MKVRFLLTIGSLWTILGLFLASAWILPAIERANTPVVYAAPRADESKPVVNEEPTIIGTPTHIAFPSVDISIDVAPGYYDASNGSWTLSKDKAHYATVTDKPNNKTGNTFIYGHNRWQVFTGLLNAKVGDKAIVTTDNGHTFTYVLREIVDTDPTDTTYMQTHGSPILTVQTCSGFWYENRRMFTFDLVEAV